MAESVLRTSIEFREQAARDLEDISTALATSKAEVIRSAVSVLAYFVRQRLEEDPSCELAIVTKNKEVAKILIIPGVPVSPWVTRPAAPTTRARNSRRQAVRSTVAAARKVSRQ